MRDRVPALDGLRGLAVLAVVLLHSGVFPWGGAGVDLFFALSGFLITGILLDAKEAGGTGWTTYGRPFYARRALRIFPVAYAAILIVFWGAPIGEQLWYWLFVSNWWVWPRSPAAWRLGHFWSLAVEEQFYLLWPWFVLACSRRKLWFVALGLLVLALITRLTIALLPLPPQVGHTYEGFTVARCDGLAVGAMLAMGARARFGLMQWRPLAKLAILVGLLLYAALSWRGGRSLYVGGYTALAALMGGLLCLTLTTDIPLLRVRPLRWIGTVSYGVYVAHPLIIGSLRDRGFKPGWALFAACTVITLALAALSWHALESPILSFKRYFPMPRRSSLAEDEPMRMPLTAAV